MIRSSLAWASFIVLIGATGCPSPDGTDPASATEDVVVALDPELGTASLIHDPSMASLPLAVEPASSAPTDVTSAFLASWGDALGLQDAQSELEITQITGDDGVLADLNLRHIRMQQVVSGLPVFGGEAILHISTDGRVGSLGGHLAPTPSVPTAPTIDADTARNTLVSLLGPDQLAERPADPDTTELGVLAPRLFGQSEDPQLAYRVRAFGYDAFVDAQSGELIFRIDEHHTARNRETSDDENNNGTAPVLVLTETTAGCPAGANPEVCMLHANMGTTYDYFDNAFGRDSDDDAGATLASIGRYGASNCPNAWSSLRFCSGLSTLDVVGHEFTHRVISNTAGLIYQNEPGALNESYADIFGWLIDNGNDFIGEGTPLEDSCGGLRSMADPAACGQPDHYEDFGGGVHTNSGIHNKAAYLIRSGGRFRTIDVQGIGSTKTGLLFYATLTTRLTSTISMPAAAAETVRACYAFALGLDGEAPGSFGFNSDDCVQVAQAMTAAGMLGQLEITEPAEGVDAPYRYGPYMNAVVIDHATSTPPSVFWESDEDGPLSPQVFGVGLPLGAREIRAKTTFASGYSATASVTVNVVNEPPVAQIFAPASGESVFQDQWVQLAGDVSDVNQIFSTGPLFGVYSSSEPSDTLVSVGAGVALARFQTLGPRTLTLTGTDELGLTDTASIIVDVVQDTSGLPNATILEIAVDDGGGFVPLDISCNVSNGELVCSTGYWRDTQYRFTAAQSPGSTYTWHFDWLGDPARRTTLGTGEVLQWHGNQMSFNCGGRWGDLVVEVENTEGIDTFSLELSLLDPPC